MENLAYCFEILDVPVGVTWTEIQRAHRELVKVWHPDRFASDHPLQKRAERKLQEINDAYAKLEAAYTASREARSSEPSPPCGYEEGLRDQMADESFESSAPRANTRRAGTWFDVLFHQNFRQWKPAYGSVFEPAMLPILGATATILVGLFLYRSLGVPHRGVFSVFDRPHVAFPLPAAAQISDRFNITAVPQLMQGGDRKSDDCSESNTFACPPRRNPDLSETTSRPLPDRRVGASRSRVATHRPENGSELIQPAGVQGGGSIQIVNQREEDIVADIWEWDSQRRLVRSVYVRSREEVVIAGIGLGIYRASFAPASFPPKATGHPQVIYRLAESMQFYEVEGSGATQAMRYVITVPQS